MLERFNVDQPGALHAADVLPCNANSADTTRGAPSSVSLDKLFEWNASSDAGIKYFSGVGTYTNTVEAPLSWFKKSAHLWIDLGDVKNLAEVTLNGEALGVVWHSPYRVDVTGLMKPGNNQLKVRVVNSWVNRLIGDEQPGATRITFADVKPYKANSPLHPSGLIGPVKLYSVTQFIARSLP